MGLALTPTVLVGLGACSTRALLRFKHQSAWRSAPVRQLARIVTVEPAGEKSLADQLRFERLANEFHFVTTTAEHPSGDPTGFVAKLQEAENYALRGRILEAVLQEGKHSVQIRPFADWFEPAVAVLADLTSYAGDEFMSLLEQLLQVHFRPVTIVLTYPAPRVAGWEEIRLTAAQLLSRYGPERVAGVWVITLERSSGDRLEPTDIEEALAYFCELFTYSGWVDNLGLRHFFAPSLSEEASSHTRLYTFGVKAVQVHAIDVADGQRCERARNRLGEFLNGGNREEADPAAELKSALERAKGRAREKCNAVTLPEVQFPHGEPDGGARDWLLRTRLHWWPQMIGVVQEELASALAGLTEQIDWTGADPATRHIRLERLKAAIESELQQNALPLPLDLGELFVAADSASRWPSTVSALVTKGGLVTATTSAVAWSFLPANLLLAWTGAAAGLSITAVAGRYLWARHEEGESRQQLDEGLRTWADARVAERIAIELREQLETARAEVARRLTEAAPVCENLREALEIVAAQKPDVPSRLTMLTVPYPADFDLPYPVESLPVQELSRGSSADMAASVLRWADFASLSGAPITLTETERVRLERALLQAAASDPSPVPYLLPMRQVDSTGDPIPKKSIVLSGARPATQPGMETVWMGDNPFLLCRFALAGPFTDKASARTEPGLPGRESA